MSDDISSNSATSSRFVVVPAIPNQEKPTSWKIFDQLKGDWHSHLGWPSEEAAADAVNYLNSPEGQRALYENDTSFPAFLRSLAAGKIPGIEIRFKDDSTIVITPLPIQTPGSADA